MRFLFMGATFCLRLSSDSAAAEDETKVPEDNEQGSQLITAHCYCFKRAFATSEPSFKRLITTQKVE
jgi:hypothetical protein